MQQEICKMVYDFKKAYPLTIGWRYKRHSYIVALHLNPGEEVLYSFIAQKNDTLLNIFQSAVVSITTERILIGHKNLIFGYDLTSITPDMFNDLKVSGGIIFGKVYIDTIKEFVTLSDIDKRALPELQTAISSYMMEQKKKYHSKEKEEK